MSKMIEIFLLKLWNTFGLLYLSFTCCLLWLILIYIRQRNLPPGPWGWPFLGSLLSIINTNVHHKYFELTQKYGKIFWLKLGQKNVVVLSDPEFIKEAFTRADFSGKPENEFYKLLGGYGIINTQGELWKKQRRFVHNNLCKFGMTLFNKERNAHLEARIMKEVNILLENMKTQNGRPMDMNNGLNICISNVICSLLMSVRFDFDDPQFRELMTKIDEGFRLFGGIVLLNYFPLLGYIPYFLREFKKIEENKQKTHSFFQQIIDNHNETFNSAELRDILDCYLDAINNGNANGKIENLFQGKDHNSQIRQTIVDLFTAGVETTKTSLQWCIIYMLHYPEVARTVQKEMDYHVGRDRLPTYADIDKLHYTQATVLEVLRKSSVVPLGNSHATTKDVYFKGFRIPKNTEIVPFLYAVNNDPTLWVSPEEFLPQRFLNSKNQVEKLNHFIPFGAGRRNCLGERLARMEIFLFFATILHTFDVKIPEGDSLPSLEGHFGITLNPGVFKVQFVERTFVDANNNVNECESNTFCTEPRIPTNPPHQH